MAVYKYDNLRQGAINQEFRRDFYYAEWAESNPAGGCGSLMKETAAPGARQVLQQHRWKKQNLNGGIVMILSEQGLSATLSKRLVRSEGGYDQPLGRFRNFEYF